jgi:hypothetical protein
VVLVVFDLALAFLVDEVFVSTIWCIVFRPRGGAYAPPFGNTGEHVANMKKTRTNVCSSSVSWLLAKETEHYCVTDGT